MNICTVTAKTATTTVSIRDCQVRVVSTDHESFNTSFEMSPKEAQELANSLMFYSKRIERDRKIAKVKAALNKCKSLFMRLLEQLEGDSN